MKPWKMFLGILALAAVLAAKPTDWKRLGAREVNFASDRDEIFCAHEGPLSALVVEVRRNGVHIEDLQVQFANGHILDVQVRAFISAGQRTRVIDLPGEDRIVKKVVFKYHSGKKRVKRAEVILFGRD